MFPIFREIYNNLPNSKNFPNEGQELDSLNDEINRRENEIKIIREEFNTKKLKFFELLMDQWSHDDILSAIENSATIRRLDSIKDYIKEIERKK